MAQKVTTEFVDDIDGTEAERTFTYAVDGVAYEIDLSTSNIKEFNEAIAGFVESSRKVGKLTAVPTSRSNGSRPQRDRQQTAAIREWARQNGLSVSERGRISAAIKAKFDAAH